MHSNSMLPWPCFVVTETCNCKRDCQKYDLTTRATFLVRGVYYEVRARMCSYWARAVFGQGAGRVQVHAEFLEEVTGLEFVRTRHPIPWSVDSLAKTHGVAFDLKPVYRSPHTSYYAKADIKEAENKALAAFPCKHCGEPFSDWWSINEQMLHKRCESAFWEAEADRWMNPECRECGERFAKSGRRVYCEACRALQSPTWKSDLREAVTSVSQALGE